MFMRKNVFLSVSALGFALCACSTQTAGTSEESEGVIALAGKEIKGAAQKGPLVTGSDVILRETSAEGNLEPTGREFHTTTSNDKGEFHFGDLDLESQYVLLSAEGQYSREYDGSRSECAMRLDAVTSLSNRITANINILTHFEYKRVLKLVGEGKPFAEAKKQASREVLGAFGVELDVSAAEDLNIFNTSEGDRTLFNLSLFIDNRHDWNFPGVGASDCQKLQDYLDGFANDFADDGVLADSIMQVIAGHAYEITRMYDRMEFIDEDDMWEKEAADPGSYDDLVVMKKEYEFSKLVLLHHLEIDACTENRWGEYTAFHKPIEVYDYQEGEQRILDSGYVLCDGYKWDIKTRGYIDSLTTMFEHENGTMIDPRDGREYKTISFEYEGKRYEWMAENLMYSVVDPETRPRGGRVSRRQPGVYSWTEAMRLNEGYMTRYVREGLIDSLHQGICPDGWHVANSEEWKTLLDYVDGNPNNLLDENWRTDRETAIAKGLTGVFYNRLDFNLVPLDKQFLEAYFHTYAPRMSFQPTSPNDDVWNREFFTRDEFIDYPLTKTDFTTIEISINWNYVSDTEVQPKGFVRCVRN